MAGSGPWDDFQAPADNGAPWDDFKPSANRLAFAPSDIASLAPPMSNSDYAKDIGKSGGIGVARGIVGLSTLPGNIEQLGRLGINYAVNKGKPQSPIVNNIADAVAKMTGNDPRNVVSPETKLPTMGDVIAKDEAQTGRKWYEPQTTAGEYARTAGEFAPSALAGGPETSLLTRALNVAVPAITSETAGQATKGTALEPYARTAGALVSGKMPNATSAARVITPIRAETTRLAHVANLENEGVTALSAGERTGNNGLRYLESEAGNTLFGGGTARAREKLKGEQATEAAWRNVGVPAKDILPETITAAQDSLSNGYESLARMTNFKVDGKLAKAVTDIGNEYDNITSPFSRSPLPSKIISDITDMAAQSPIMPGAKYQKMRSDIGKAMKQARGTDGYLANTLGELQSALDEAMARGANPKIAAAWKLQNARYRDFLAIQDAAGRAGENTANGILSMPALRNALAKQEGKNFAKSQRPIVKLARSAEGVMKPMPNSGTAARQGLRRFLSAGGALVGVTTGAAAGGPVGAGVGGLLGLVGPLVGEGVAAKMLTSKLAQKYLGNQAVTSPLAAYNAGKSTPWWFLPQGLSAAEAEAAGSPSASKKKK